MFDNQHPHNTSADDATTCRSAFSTAGVSETFSTIIGSRMVVGFDQEPDTTVGWVSEQPVPTFLGSQLFALEQGARITKLARGTAAKHISIAAKKSNWGIARYAGQFVVDEIDLENGRTVGALLLAAEQMGAAARRLRPDLIYALLLGNPTLEADTIDLFHANHANYATGGGSALSATTLDTGLAAVGNHHLTDSLGDAIHLNPRAAFLVVPPQLVGLGRRTVRNMVLGDGEDVQVRQESRLGTLGVVDRESDVVVSGSATNWLLTAKASALPAVVIGGLNGNLGPTIRRYDLDNGEWGMAWDVTCDIGAAAIDYRGLYYAAGA